MLKRHKTIALLFFINILPFSIFAQDKTIDQIVAIIGTNIVLKSDIESLNLQNLAQGITSEGDMKCDILENMLIEKLLVAEAELDTNIIITDNQINQQLDMRIQYFLQHLGSEKEVEKYFKKPIVQLKSELKDVISDELMSGQMKNKIIDPVKVTPSEVRHFYRSLSDDEKPKINTQYEYAQITIVPQVSENEDIRIKNELRNIKKRIEDGENFSMFAVLYSECPSSRDGGDLGFFGRATMDPAFSSVAFNLKQGQISNVVRSDFGYHIIQLQDRRGDQIRAKHILIKPKVEIEVKENALMLLDSISNEIRKEKISFTEAAMRYSDDKNSRNNGGIVVNPQNMSARFEVNNLKPDVSKILSKMEVNEISKPFITVDDKQREVIAIVKLISKVEAHIASISEDYPLLSNLYLQQKQDETIKKWVAERQNKTYIRIDETYQNCDFKYSTWVK